MSTIATLAAEARSALAGSFNGTLTGPDDAGYDEARSVYNAMIDRRPALVARCTSAADVAAGFCAGTPLRMEMAARGGLAEGTKVVAEEMTARLGAGPVTASMTAYVVEARPSPRLPG